VIHQYSSGIGATLTVTLWLLAAWCALSTAEWVVNFGVFKSGGLLSWHVLALRRGRLFRSSWSPYLFSSASVGLTLFLRIVAAAALCLSQSSITILSALILIVASCLFLTVRTGYGGDGSDQMGCIGAISASLMTAGVIAKQPWISFSGTVLLGGQLTLAYFISGISKLLSATWRRGHSLNGIMTTYTYGHPLAAKLSAYRACSLLVCWIVISSETLFPFAVIAPHRWFVAILAGFFLFHLGNAFFMGLNSFVWSFTAAYPSAFLLNDFVRVALRLDR
jgi:hypothetical protein